MKEDLINKTNRRNAEEVLSSVAGGQGYEHRVMLAVEAAMAEEWWRGFYAGQRAERRREKST